MIAAGCGRPAGTATSGTRDPRAIELAKEVHNLGWIVYGARTDKGDWDLFMSRPDGSDCRDVTNTPDYNEAAARFSPDGSKLLYRRFAKGQTVDGNRYGLQGELIIANSRRQQSAGVRERGRVSLGFLGSGRQTVRVPRALGHFLRRYRLTQSSPHARPQGHLPATELVSGWQIARRSRQRRRGVDHRPNGRRHGKFEPGARVSKLHSALVSEFAAAWCSPTARPVRRTRTTERAGLS